MPCAGFSLQICWRGQPWRKCVGMKHCTKGSAALISGTPRIPARTENDVNTAHRQGTVPRPPIWRLSTYRIISSPTGSFCHLTHLQLLYSRCQVDSQRGFCKSHPKYDLEKKKKKNAPSYEPTVHLKDPAHKSFAPVPFSPHSKLILKRLWNPANSTCAQ